MQRRNDIKVPVNISVTLSAKPARERFQISRLRSGTSAQEGFFYKPPVIFTRRYRFLPFSNPDLPSLTLQVEILRLQAHRELRKIIGSEAKDTELTGYGCQFVHLPSRAESQIRNYVFRQDLIHRRWVSSLD